MFLSHCRPCQCWGNALTSTLPLPAGDLYGGKGTGFTVLGGSLLVTDIGRGQTAVRDQRQRGFAGVAHHATIRVGGTPEVWRRDDAIRCAAVRAPTPSRIAAGAAVRVGRRRLASATGTAGAS